MKQAQILALARDAGFKVYEGAFPFEPTEDKYIGFEDNLERFAALVAAHERKKHRSPSWETVDDAIAAEREACAKVCEQDEFQIYETAEWCAAAIRARG